MRILELENKRVAVWGYGKEGRSLVGLLRRSMPDLALTVLNDTPLSGACQYALADQKHIDLVWGNKVGAALQNFDIVFKSPGISLYRPEIIAAKAAGVRFTSATQLWFDENPNAPTICITGTKGKSTTCTLITHLLNASGVSALSAGNIGRPLIDVLNPTPVPRFWVIELSSYQISDLKASPSIAVLLNLFPEHLDWHGSKSVYFRDKLNLFTHLGQNIAVVNRSDPETSRRFPKISNTRYFNSPQGIHCANGFIWDRDKLLLPISRVNLPGAHNLSNICAAFTVIQALGGITPQCIAAVASFEGLPHRLRIIGRRSGVDYIDDSISTTPESALAAISAYPGKKITLLLGGYDRGLSYHGLCSFLTAHPVFAVITMPETGPRIAETLHRLASTTVLQPNLIVKQANDLAEAVAIAQKITPAGGIILLSPAAPSYGQFQNFEARGRAFAAAAGLDQGGEART